MGQFAIQFRFGFGLRWFSEIEINPTDGKPYTVQYFQRNRFEYHPELAGTPYSIQLGLLGVQYTAKRLFILLKDWNHDA